MSVNHLFSCRAVPDIAIRKRERSWNGGAQDVGFLAQGLPRENPIVFDLDNEHPSGSTDRTVCHFRSFKGFKVRFFTRVRVRQ